MPFVLLIDHSTTDWKPDKQSDQELIFGLIQSSISNVDTKNATAASDNQFTRLSKIWIQRFWWLPYHCIPIINRIGWGIWSQFLGLHNLAWSVGLAAAVQCWLRGQTVNESIAKRSQQKPNVTPCETEQPVDIYLLVAFVSYSCRHDPKWTGDSVGFRGGWNRRIGERPKGSQSAVPATLYVQQRTDESVREGTLSISPLDHICTQPQYGMIYGRSVVSMQQVQTLSHDFR